MTETGTELAPPARRQRPVVKSQRRRDYIASLTVTPPKSRQPEEMQARLRLRHILILLHFVVTFLVPSVAANWYLQFRAADRFEAKASFTVQADDFLASTGMFSEFLIPESAEATDTDILYDFLYSQEVVERIDARLDLRTLFRREAERDPFFSLGPENSVEALLAYWPRAFDVVYEPRQGVIGINARAFRAEDARRIAEAAVEEARILVNRLSDAARRDAIRYAENDVAETRARLDAMRERLRSFRNTNRSVLPEAEVQAQTSLLSFLEDSLARELVAKSQLLDTTRPDDPRLAAADRRIEAVTAQIAAERARVVSASSPGAVPISGLLGQYEELKVDHDFAVAAYVSALKELALAKAEAHRQARYLALHVAPSRPEAATLPDRVGWGFLIPFLAFTAWFVSSLLIYNVRDNV